jgi:hypothetical protein
MLRRSERRAPSAAAYEPLERRRSSGRRTTLPCTVQIADLPGALEQPTGDAIGRPLDRTELRLFEVIICGRVVGSLTGARVEEAATRLDRSADELEREGDFEAAGWEREEAERLRAALVRLDEQELRQIMFDYLDFELDEAAEGDCDEYRWVGDLGRKRRKPRRAVPFYDRRGTLVRLEPARFVCMERPRTASAQRSSRPRERRARSGSRSSRGTPDPDPEPSPELVGALAGAVR